MGHLNFTGTRKVHNMHLIAKTIAAAALLTASIGASATPVTFDIAGAPTSYVTVDTDCFIWCSATPTLNAGLDQVSFSLSAGEERTFHFFDLDLHGIGSGTIEAYLGFDSPTGAPVAEGSGYGSFGGLAVITGGLLNWTSQPGLFQFEDGTVYSVVLNSLWGATFGSTVSVTATIKLLSEPGSVAVPEPGTMGLLGLGLLAMGFVGRRRATKK